MLEGLTSTPADATDIDTSGSTSLKVVKVARLGKRCDGRSNGGGIGGMLKCLTCTPANATDIDTSGSTGLELVKVARLSKGCNG